MNKHRERRECSERELMEEANDLLQGISDSFDIQTGILQQILDAIGGQSVTPATGGTLFQLGENKVMGAITGTKVGGSSTFAVTWNGGMQPGAPVVWTSNDPGISFVPVPTDPTGNTVQVADAVLDANTSYTLDVAGTASDGNPVKATTATVPLSQTAATGGDIGQLS